MLASPLSLDELLALWRELTGEELERPKGKTLRVFAKALEQRTHRADWLPVVGRAAAIRERRGEEAAWLTLRWLAKNLDEWARVLAGEFDRTFGARRGFAPPPNRYVPAPEPAGPRPERGEPLGPMLCHGCSSPDVLRISNGMGGWNPAPHRHPTTGAWCVEPSPEDLLPPATGPPNELTNQL